MRTVIYDLSVYNQVILSGYCGCPVWVIVSFMRTAISEINYVG